MNIYFSSSQNWDKKAFEEVNKKISVLISNEYIDSWIRKDKEALRALIPLLKDNFIFDSGAFTVWKSGGRVDFEKYIDRCIELNEFFEGKFIAVNLDLIPGKFGEKPSEINIEESCQKSFENYLYFKSKFKGKIMPVFHQHDTYQWLDKYIELKPPILGISPANDMTTMGRIPFLDECFKKTRDITPCHGLAVLSQRLLERYPWYSTDASTFASQTGRGSVFYFEKGKIKNYRYREVEKSKIHGQFNQMDNLGTKNHQNRRVSAIKAILELENHINNLWKSRGITWQPIL